MHDWYLVFATCLGRLVLPAVLLLTSFALPSFRSRSPESWGMSTPLKRGLSFRGNAAANRYQHHLLNASSFGDSKEMPLADRVTFECSFCPRNISSEDISVILNVTVFEFFPHILLTGADPRIALFVFVCLGQRLYRTYPARQHPHSLYSCKAGPFLVYIHFGILA